MIDLREFAGVAGATLIAAGFGAVLLKETDAPKIALHKPAPRVTKPAKPVTIAPIAIAVAPTQEQAPSPAIEPKPEPTPQAYIPASARPAPALAPQMLVADPAMADEEAAGVARRLEARIPSDLAPYFDLYLYVSKAADGPWAQHLFVFRKDRDGALVFERRFAVSTGRERDEDYFTTTPAGIFELDPDRFYRITYSARWHDAPMPHAMFLNYSFRTRMTGVALHAATGRLVKKLGHRASGGCVRLPPDMATLLFKRISETERGDVPVLAFDESRGTTNVTGGIARARNGDPLVAPGFRVLVVIADAPGPVAETATPTGS